MKIKSGFILRDVGGKTFVVAVGERSKEFRGMITLNETGKFIWKMLEKGATINDVVDSMLSVYEGADREVIEKDVSDFVSKLQGDNILE